jgi:LacI family transcriptional regulator
MHPSSKLLDTNPPLCYNVYDTGNDNGNLHETSPLNYFDSESAMPVRQRVTIKQVAKEAGVSTQTVSRVINERPDVAHETRQRVLEVIERLGYQPSALARSLIRRRSHTLGVVIAGLKYIGPSRTLSGITEQAEAMSYSLLLKELPAFDTGNVEPILDALLARQVDGIIWAVSEVGNNRDWLHSRLPELSIPIIFLTMDRQPNLSIVSVDNYTGGRMATEHLLQQGYRRIGHIAGPLAWWEARQRKAGWQDALRDAGISVNRRQWCEGNWSSESGEKATHQLLDQYPEMDAIFVGNDQMALGVSQVARQKGLRIPQDLAVVGFDDIPEGAYYWPPLSTVKQDQHQLGCVAVEKLVRMIEASQVSENTIEPETIWLKPELIVRESSFASPQEIEVAVGQGSLDSSSSLAP